MNFANGSTLCYVFTCFCMSVRLSVRLSVCLSARSVKSNEWNVDEISWSRGAGPRDQLIRFCVWSASQSTHWLCCELLQSAAGLPAVYCVPKLFKSHFRTSVLSGAFFHRHIRLIFNTSCNYLSSGRSSTTPACGARCSAPAAPRLVSRVVIAFARCRLRCRPDVVWAPFARCRFPPFPGVS